MAGWFTEDGSIDVRAFNGWDSVVEFMEIEERYWKELAKDEASFGVRVALDRINSEQRKLRGVISNARNYNAASPNSGVQALVNAYDGPDGVLISTGSKIHIARKDVEEVAGSSAAIFHIAFKRGLVSLADARDADDLIGALWDVAPGLADTTTLGTALKSERERLRQSVRSLSAAVEAAEKNRSRDFDLLVSAAKNAGKKWAVRRNLRMRNQLRYWRSHHAASEASIKAVEDTYKEHMGLKAPVEYWQKKAESHGRSERLLRLLVTAFFAVAITAIIIAFWNVGWTLINLSLAPGAKPLPPGVYVVASAGLGSAAGVLFWGGRLLTKLYLSQHHLRQDAEERATMTETYLALIENQAADTEDRQVILNALFRATPDGIVKEEGGLDPSIAAALGKFLAK
jgi:hypothetical protein